MTTDMATYSAREVCELVGVTYRQLDYWMREGMFGDGASTPGSGNRRRFTPQMIEAIDAVNRLIILCGMSPPAFVRAEVASLVTNAPVTPEGDMLVITPMGGWSRVLSSRSTWFVPTSHQPTLVLPLRQFDAILDARAV